MPAGKESSRSRGKGSTRPSKRGGRVAETAKLSQGAPVVDIDPWSSFFERFWEQVDGEGIADQHGGDRPAGRSKPMAGAKPRG